MPNNMVRDGARYFVCCLCDDAFRGYGNNPEPLVTPPDDDAEWGEECCDDCNGSKVIPARMKEIGLLSR